MEQWIQQLDEHHSFPRRVFYQTLRDCGCQLSDEGLKKRLEKAVKDGIVIRDGRDSYTLSPKLQRAQYRYAYSALSCQAAELLHNRYPYLSFSVFELIQLNEFVNHQIAHNTVFISVEADVMEFAFETLKEAFPGRVLIAPTPELYRQYWVEDMLVVIKLVSEAPKSSVAPWHIPLEKLLVDLVADPLLRNAVSESEYPAVFEGALARYLVNENGLLRYARRRTAEKVIRLLLEEAR